MSDVVHMDAHEIGIAAVRAALREPVFERQTIKAARKKPVWRWFFYPPLLAWSVCYWLPSHSLSSADQLQGLCQRHAPAGIIGRAEALVTQQLKSPATAKFPGSTEEPPKVLRYPDCAYEVSGWVDAQNGFGALMRSIWRVEMKPVLNDRGEVEWKGLYATLRDGQ